LAVGRSDSWRWSARGRGAAGKKNAQPLARLGVLGEWLLLAQVEQVRFRRDAVFLQTSGAFGCASLAFAYREHRHEWKEE
jgi:hypothetical protein